MRKTLIIIAFLIGVVGAVIVLMVAKPQQSTPATLQSDNVTKVLFIKTSSGAQVDNMEKGARVAVELINKSTGILGKNISLISVDASDSKISEEEITRNIDQHKPLFIVASAANALNVARIVHDKQITTLIAGHGQLVTCTPDVKLEEAKAHIKSEQKTLKSTEPIMASPYIWQIGLTPEMSIEPFLVFLADKLKPQKDRLRVFIFGNNDERSLAFSRHTSDLAESLNFDIANDGFVDYRITDFFQYVRHIFGRTPDLLLVPAKNEATFMFIKQALKLGIRSEMSIAGMLPFAEEEIPRYENLSEGIYTSTNYLPGTQNELNAQFFEAWKKSYPNAIPTSAAVDGYNSFLIASTAYERGKGTSPEAFTSGMNDLEIKVPQGRMLINIANHTATQPLFAVTIKNKAYEYLEQLGPVSHPKFEGCVN